ncbi:PEP-CTERM sorting domain-containing protein [Laspinema olomoucense]|uniref:PEP-CTERM sorting domain-containing protein n=1 Tax=Laspinema olomoucense TaxID=3231600 RepID=UPI0021BB2459|nr:PEP-CTERM sorting domain-containing protein [Laspinema sp. D3c]MCT7992923.1 PEP-CTERM sorting domain-containing protein [Laspinema sp. D3c]
MMKATVLKTILGTAAATVGLMGVTAPQVQAGTLHNGWNYAIDSFKDGAEGNIIGANSAYEMYGMAVKEDTQSNSIFVAINANLPITGDNYGGAADGHIGWGDLIFNFSGQNLQTANASGNLFGIRFAQNNDSGVSSVGVYDNVTLRSVTSTNSGFNNLTHHANLVASQRGSASMGDLAYNDSYFAGQITGTHTVLNSIKTGNLLGGINVINNFAGLGLDFGNFSATGTHTFGFSFDKSLMPVGEFVATLFAECANDGIALMGEFTVASVPGDDVSVPEPSSMLGLLALGLTFAGSLSRKKGKAIASEV